MPHFNSLIAPSSASSTPIQFVHENVMASVLETHTKQSQTRLLASGFKGKSGQIGLIFNEAGDLDRVLFCIESETAAWRDPFLAGKLPASLRAGTYHFEGAVQDMTTSALAFLGGQYKFSHYTKPSEKLCLLKLDARADAKLISVLHEGVSLTRDLVNIPANDMGPAELEMAALKLAKRFNASFSSIIGEELLQKNFPLIYHVGKASTRAPRLIDITWGDETHPKVTLVGKGVCFDTGGLNIKPDAGMLLMKKDMGGAATSLGLAFMIMALGLKVRLRLLIPAVENSIAGNAFRPSDIYPSRKGLTVEIGNTDAEGRLVLADALALADEEAPEIMIDFATLTGAARVALGPDLPPLYTHDAKLGAEIQAAGFKVHDPVWQMPLWMPYFASMDGKISDVSSTGSLPFAGSITAAHFLNRFVEKTKSYVHFDVFAWAPVEKPGRPMGGECQAARACLDVLISRYK